MKKWELFKKTRFNQCQATETFREDEDGNTIILFYSYQCPELVKIAWNWYKFTYEDSRKAGAITGSRTTSKQITKYFWYWKDLPKMSLKDFEQNYFSTNIDGLY